MAYVFIPHFLRYPPHSCTPGIALTHCQEFAGAYTFTPFLFFVALCLVLTWLFGIETVGRDEVGVQAEIDRTGARAPVYERVCVCVCVCVANVCCIVCVCMCVSLCV